MGIKTDKGIGTDKEKDSFLGKKKDDTLDTDIFGL